MAEPDARGVTKTTKRKTRTTKAACRVVEMLEPGRGAVEIRTGHVVQVLRALPDGAAQAIATSPPYWGLRDYRSTPQVWGGDPGCTHTFGANGLCVCEAWQGVLGGEPTIQLYVRNLVEVFREARRVLRDDGVLMLNLGDTYSSGNRTATILPIIGRHDAILRAPVVPELKPKDIAGIPWRVALALQEDGWYLRGDIVWAKGVSFNEEYSGSIMPEAVLDRPTRSHEFIFMLTKGPKYFWDAEAIREVGAVPAGTRAAQGSGTREGNRRSTPGEAAVYDGSRNVRSVWMISTRGFSGEFCTACQAFFDGPDKRRLTLVPAEVPQEPSRRTEAAIDAARRVRRVCSCGRDDAWLSHFATWPLELATVLVRATTSAGGACSACRRPYTRVTTREVANGVPTVKTAGWACNCDCEADRGPCVILDPFFGSGTTGMAALREGRAALGVELNTDYAEMARQRILADAPVLNRVGVVHA